MKRLELIRKELNIKQCSTALAKKFNIGKVGGMYIASSSEEKELIKYYGKLQRYENGEKKKISELLREIGKENQLTKSNKLAPKFDLELFHNHYWASPKQESEIKKYYGVEEIEEQVEPVEEKVKNGSNFDQFYDIRLVDVIRDIIGCDMPTPIMRKQFKVARMAHDYECRKRENTWMCTNDIAEAIKLNGITDYQLINTFDYKENNNEWKESKEEMARFEKYVKENNKEEVKETTTTTQEEEFVEDSVIYESIVRKMAIKFLDKYMSGDIEEDNFLTQLDILKEMDEEL